MNPWHLIWYTLGWFFVAMGALTVVYWLAVVIGGLAMIVRDAAIRAIRRRRRDRGLVRAERNRRRA